ncbi:MAG: UDP-N-acetylmuramate dehydrogenase [Candidatus Harrisonbacteria bacterium]|nr:UDP-N-acetylmuramate dehydrogenase [Candidatus Harrisonbacteria bacterium]
MIKVQKNRNLAPLSTFKIGGQVKFFCEVGNDRELLEAIRAAKRLKAPYKIIAGGSNVVFPDKTLNCLLIKISSKNIKAAGNKIIVDAGVPLSRVIAVANKNGLQGLETLAGIPGTVGGAIVGNAGAYGRSISEVAEKVEVWNPSFAKATEGDGKKWLLNKECQFQYRESVFKKKPWIALRAVLRFKKSNPKKLKRISRDIIQLRLKKYKPGLKCPGSFFKNVLIKDISKKSLAKIAKAKIIDGKIPAGYLLEEVGAKGMRVGGIQIADFHGNLFINSGKGKASEVKKLAKILKNRVKKKFGITLQEEVRYF